MDVVDLVARVRDHFLEQFGGFVDQQLAEFKLGSPEVKLELDDDSPVYAGLYCVDFIRPLDEDEQEDSAVDRDIQDEDEEGEAGGVLEFQPALYLEFEPTAGSFGGMDVLIENLHWNDVVIQHDLATLPEEPVEEWFEAWFDPDDERHDPEAKFAGVIHSLVVDAGLVSVDFGTAHAAAFWDLLELLEASGAKKLVITCSDEPDDDDEDYAEDDGDDGE